MPLESGTGNIVPVLDEIHADFADLVTCKHLVGVADGRLPRLERAETVVVETPVQHSTKLQEVGDTVMVADYDIRLISVHVISFVLTFQR